MRIVRSLNGFHGIAAVGFVRKTDRSQESSCDRDDLSYDLGVVMEPKLYGTIELPRVRMHYESAVFDPAARAQIRSIPLEKDVDWLLPKGL